MPPLPLAEWNSFYVLVGSAAAGLTGLTFVVISLAAEKRRASEVGLRTFVTPTVVHFAAVFALAAYLSAPHQNVTSLCLGLGVAGTAGLVYIGTVAAAMRGLRALYVPVREDWIWNAILPALSYVSLLAMAALCRHKPEYSLYGVGTVSIVLLFIGIHNAWDVAVWNSVTRQRDSDSNG
jgi:hypothetical protein